MYGLECEKCGKSIPYGISVRLIGGVHTVLCPLCQTEWDEHVVGLDAFKEHSRLYVVQMSIAHARELDMDGVDPALQQVQDALLTCRRALHKVGLEWLGREL